MIRQHYPARGRARLRQGRSSETGRIYLVTFTTRDRFPLFTDWSIATVFARTLTNRLLWRASRLHCWVLMPNHWHGLIEPGPQDTLSTLVGRIKACTARAVNQARATTSSVWADGFHDHAVRKEEDVVDMARYIVLNPVRAGMVDRAGLYPFWDAIWIGAGRAP
ncbi:transposase [Dokdonella sp.]|uniref:REP-associated tyrosine transposase n=1 Tax=Dokdonella sp. TaxID=2291710 RepID=UPI0035275072